MRYIKWTFLGLVSLLIFGFLHYTLPQHDIVRITGTYEERQDLGDWTRMFWAAPDDQASGLINRDVQFIQTIKANGKPMVYRNEDTGWGWPPYFKLDTATLYAEASDAKSDKASPEWYSMTHYGWRNEYFSAFPNAIALKAVAGPDVRIIPWVNIIILTVLFFIGLLFYRMWAQFRERTIDPLLENAEDAWDSVDERAHDASKRARGWFGTWRGKPRK